MHFACKSGCIKIVKYLTSLPNIDITAKSVFISYFYVILKIIFLFNFKVNFFFGISKSKKVNETILHSACESGNIYLVIYFISLNIFDTKSKTIISYFLNDVFIISNHVLISKYFMAFYK